MKMILLAMLGIMVLVCGLATLAVHITSERPNGWETESMTWAILTASSLISFSVVAASYRDR